MTITKQAMQRYIDDCMARGTECFSRAPYFNVYWQYQLR
jgi:hypothetical protein